MMSSKGGILIVSASTGTGHGRAAEAVRQALQAREPGRRVEHIDLLELAPRWVRAAYGNGYELIATRAPWVWKQVYVRTDTPSAELARWGPAANRVLFRTFRRVLLSGEWASCLCTHFLPGQLAAGLPGLPPFSTVITDLTLHRFWAQPRVSRFFVASEALAASLAPRVPGSTIEVTGIPIDPRFAAAPPREEARNALGLPQDARVVLVMGGGLGLGVEEMARAAARARVAGLRVVTVCGRNERAAERLRSVPDPERVRLEVIGYTTEIPRLLAAADLVVTKPGGLTTSEALAVGRPLLLTRAIPGQEEGNVRALTGCGSAAAAADDAAITTQVERLFGEPARLEALAAAARELGRRDSAGAVAESMLRELGGAGQRAA